jgi:DNA-binding transcriptional MerR regulator
MNVRTCSCEVCSGGKEYAGILEQLRKGIKMSGYHYQISEASRLLAVEAHVLRYWEEELGMLIPRNEMGHRYYTEEHLRIFSQIKDMKERGYQLRAIRAILSGEEPPEPVITEIPLKKDNQEPVQEPGQEPVRIPSSNPEQIPESDRSMPLEIHNPETSPKPGEIQSWEQQNHELDAEAAERMREFQSVMTRIVAQAMLYNNDGLAKDISCRLEAGVFSRMQEMADLSEHRQEERFRRLDESIRSIQQGNKARYEVAAAKSPRLFGRRKRKARYRR